MPAITIPITLINLQDDGFHLLVEIVVFGHKRFAVLDTGASRSVFDLSFLSAYLPELERTEEMQATTLFTTSSTFRAVIPQLKIGRLRLDHYEIVALDLGGVNQTYEGWGHPRIAAIIGSDLLLKYKAIINYNKMKLYLYKQ